MLQLLGLNPSLLLRHVRGLRGTRGSQRIHTVLVRRSERRANVRVAIVFRVPHFKCKHAIRIWAHSPGFGLRGLKDLVHLGAASGFLVSGLHSSLEKEVKGGRLLLFALKLVVAIARFGWSHLWFGVHFRIITIGLDRWDQIGIRSRLGEEARNR